VEPGGHIGSTHAKLRVFEGGKGAR
jgi:hypothetical protein